MNQKKSRMLLNQALMKIMINRKLQNLKYVWAQYGHYVKVKLEAINLVTALFGKTLQLNIVINLY